ncbi:fungal-specific transcription factor domain-containing protein [Lipomyces oligophaga]|uniref:fungal-specific transcription factor domain-containing protein n=1 Tax=Lipomyces oligophaga TaxID=45792 RepID=UPI0034CEC3BA
MDETRASRWAYPENLASRSPTPDSDNQEHAENPSSKRRRIARACDWCRKKKIKCDGKLPACANCLNYKTECIFTYTEKKRNPPKNVKYIENLESRLQKMEECIRSLVSQSDNEKPEHSPSSASAVSHHMELNASSSSSRSPLERQRPLDTVKTGPADSISSSRRTPTLDSSTSQSMLPLFQIINDEDISAHTRAPSDQDSACASKEASAFIIDGSEQGSSKFVGSSSTFSLFSPQGLRWIEEKSGTSEVTLAVQKVVAGLNGGEATVPLKCIPEFNYCRRISRSDGRPITDGIVREAQAHRQLPTRSLTEKCIQLYLGLYEPFIPVFSFEELNEICGRVYDDPTSCTVIDYISINIIIAIGLRCDLIDQSFLEEEQLVINFHSDVVEQILRDQFPAAHRPSNAAADKPVVRQIVDASWDFFLNAADYFRDILCGRSSVYVVQTLILIGIYLEGSEYHEESFIVHMNASRMAMSMGLHLRNGSMGLSESERIKRHKIFWICYIVDKDKTLKSGRPPVINDVDVTLPGPSKDFISVSEVFKIMYEFSRIQSKIYDRLYSANAWKLSDFELLEIIGELDKELLEWRDRIPLQYRPDHEIAGSDRRMIIPYVYVHMTYYNALSAIHRMSIHHPAWRRPLRTSSKSKATPRNPRVFASAAVCVQSARATVYLLRYFDGVELSSGWMATYFVLTALVTLFGNCLQNPTQSSASADIALMENIVRYVSLVFETANNMSVCNSGSVFFEELLKVARMVIDRARSMEAGQTDTPSGSVASHTDRLDFDRAKVATPSGLDEAQPASSDGTKSKGPSASLKGTERVTRSNSRYPQEPKTSPTEIQNYASEDGAADSLAKTGPTASVLGHNTSTGIANTNDPKSVPYIFPGPLGSTDIIGVFDRYQGSSTDGQEDSTLRETDLVGQLQAEAEERLWNDGIESCLSHTPPNPESNNPLMFDPQYIPKDMWTFPTAFTWDWGNGMSSVGGSYNPVGFKQQTEKMQDEQN